MKHHIFTSTLPSRLLKVLLAIAATATGPALVAQEVENTLNRVQETFTGTSLENPGDWEMGNISYFGEKRPYLTAASGEDSDGTGWLRLTENVGNQSGYIRYKGKPVKSEGLTIYAAFDFSHWDSGGGESPTKSADGTSFYIYDADYVDNFHVGGFGGSLGYAPMSNTSRQSSINNAPSSLTARALSSSSMMIYWTDNSVLEETFVLERNTSASTSGANYVSITLPRNTSSYVDTGLNPGTTYYYRVRATGTLLNSVRSAATNWTSWTNAATSAASADNGSDSTIVTSHSFTIRVNPRTANINGITNRMLVYIGSTLVNTQTYNTRNRDYGDLDVTFTHSQASAFTLGNLKIVFETNTTDWRSNNYLMVYYVVIDGTTYLARDCATSPSPGWDGWDYEYFAGNNATLDFNTHTSRTDSFLGTSSTMNAPTGLSAAPNATNTAIVLNWTDNATGETGHRVQYREGTSGSWTDVNIAGSNVKTYTHAATPGVSYQYRVRAYSGSAYTASSNTVTASIPVTTGTLITVRAFSENAGDKIYMRIYGKGDLDRAGSYTVQEFTLGTLFAYHNFYTTADVDASQICIHHGGTWNRRVIVDYLDLNKSGVDPYQTERCAFNSASPAPIGNHGSFSESMDRPGYVDYATYSAGGAPIDPLGGLSGGYIGVGMDDWGNYSNPTEGRIGGPGFIYPAIAVRGDEASNYKYLVGTGDDNVADLERNMNFPNAKVRPIFKPDLRRLSVIITPDNQLTAFIKYGTGDVEALFTADLKSQVRPKNIMFGFASSTGGTYANHDIRNVIVTTFKSLIWTNGGGDKLWETGMNWLVGSTPEEAKYEDVEFESKERQNTFWHTPAYHPVDVVDGAMLEEVTLTKTVSLHTITLSAADIEYRLGGADIILNDTTEGASINATAFRHVINSNVLAAEEFNFNATSGARLTINGAVNNGGYRMRLTGKGTIVLTGVVSGEGGVRIEDDGFITFTGAEDNTYDGVNTMQEGTLYLNKLGPLKDSDGAFIFRQATGYGPIIMSCVEQATAGTNAQTSRRTSRIILQNNNQIENNVDILLEGGELDLNGFVESGDTY